jgi:hypothetical protein
MLKSRHPTAVSNAQVQRSEARMPGIAEGDSDARATVPGALHAGAADPMLALATETTPSSILITAQNVLAKTCRCRADQAADALLDAAQHHHISAQQLARGLLELIGALPAGEFHGSAAAAFEHWGPRLKRVYQLHYGAIETRRA